MGVLKKVVNDLDNSKEATEEVREALRTLMELADMHMENYYDQLIENLREGKLDVAGKEQLKVPITYVTKEYKEVRVTTQDSTSKILENVTSVISDMIDDKSTSGILNGISSIVTEALDTILGAGKGMEQSVQCYAVAVDYPAIVRYDFSFWGRNIEAEGIRKYCESAIACIALRSAVDCKALAFNDFLSVAAPVLNRGFGDDPTKMEEMIEKAKKVYSLYKEDAIVPRTNRIDLSQYSTKPMIVVHPPVRATQGNF